MKLESSWNWKKNAVLTLRSSPPTSSETYPYQKGEHNGAEGAGWSKAKNLDNILELTLKAIEAKKAD